MDSFSRVAEHILNPATGLGALVCGVVFSLIAGIVAALLKRALSDILKHDQHRRIDRTYAIFLVQLLQIGIYVCFLILYMHIVPALHSLATALLAGVSVISVVFGLAAQNTLGNLVAGIAVILYRPFGVGDTIQVIAPRGSETGVVESISLGYTVLITSDNRRVMVPNSAAMNQTTVNLTHANLPPT